MKQLALPKVANKREREATKVLLGTTSVIAVLLFQAAVIGAYLTYFVWSVIRGLFK